MTPERYQRINDLADEVLEIPAASREVYLSRACVGDPGLRQQVQLLVEAHESSGAFLEQPALERLAHEIAQTRNAATLAGREIGKYCVLSRLGAGGHGEVWLAEDTRLLRNVAIKLLSADLGTHPEQVHRLYAEARICSALNHPNIVTIYDTGQVEGNAFLAQEYVEGETLRRRLARGPMPVEDAARIVQQVAAALAASHAAGVIHQDIKPENIMIRPDGLVKVLDFGLARFVKREQSKESSADGTGGSGTVMGTVKYMSPEQARGLAVDARTDIFSLGVVFFEMLTGKTPFTGATPEAILTAVLHQEPDLAGVPRSMEALVRRCLARDRDQRYASAPLLLPELDHATHGRHVKRRRWLVAAALVVVVAAGFAAYRARMNAIAPAPFEMMRISLLTTSAPAPSAAISPDGTRIAYVLEEPQGQSLWLRTLGSAAADTRLIAAEAGDHRRLAFSQDGGYVYYSRMPTSRGGALYRVAVSGGPAEKIFDSVNDAFAVAPDGHRIAFMRIDQERWEESVVVVGIDGRGERTVTTRRRPQYYASNGMAWSPDGKSLLCTAGSAPFYNADAFHLVRIDVASGAEKPIGRHTWAWVGSLLWSKDGRSLIVGANDHSIGSFQVWRVGFPGGDTRRITNDLSNYENLTLSADAKTLLAVRHDKTSDLMVAPQSGANFRIASPALHDLNSAGWAGGARIVYSALGGSAMNLWSIDSNGQHRKQLTNADRDQSEVEVSPDGRYIFFTSGGRLWRVNADGSDLRTLTPGPLDVHPAVTPDGEWLVYAAFQGWSPGIGGPPTLWKVRVDGGDRMPLTREPTSCPSVSPDGTKIACAYFPPGQATAAPKIAVYPIQGGEVLRIFDRPAGAEDNVYWSADGKGMDYLVTDPAGSRILRQMLKGGAPVLTAAFPGERLSFVRPSPDGGSVAIARGNEARELVVLRDVGE